MMLYYLLKAAKTASLFIKFPAKISSKPFWIPVFDQWLRKTS